MTEADQVVDHSSDASASVNVDERVREAAIGPSEVRASEGHEREARSYEEGDPFVGWPDTKDREAVDLTFSDEPLVDLELARR